MIRKTPSSTYVFVFRRVTKNILTILSRSQLKHIHLACYMFDLTYLINLLTEITRSNWLPDLTVLIEGPKVNCDLQHTKIGINIDTTKFISQSLENYGKKFLG